MINLAGTPTPEADAACAEELKGAGIEVLTLPMLCRGEVDTHIMGSVGPWAFERAWYYWVATGPGIPPAIATDLHEKHGKSVRVNGHCGAPSPQEQNGGFAVGIYHVDTQDGLNALAAVIREIKETSDGPA